MECLRVSVLGPLLFLLYINDIQESSGKLSFYPFVDDTNILFADKNLKSLELSGNQELNKVYDWLTANKLTLIIKKSNFVIFCPAQRKLTYQPKLVIFDNEQNKKVALEYLGILIDKNLSWKYHIDHITIKVSRTVGLIAKLRHFLPTYTLLICLKPGFHMIANDRRRSRIVDRRSQTIADRGSQIADDRGSWIADRKRSQRKVLSHYSVLGYYENYGLWAILWLDLISEM